MEIEVPRDRISTFEPQILPKHQTRFTGFDAKIVSMYARGMTTREIEGHLKEIYNVEVSPGLISQVTGSVNLRDTSKAASRGHLKTGQLKR